MTVKEKVEIQIPKPHGKEQLEFIKCVVIRQIIKAGRRFGKTYAVAIKDVYAFLGICPICGGGGCEACVGGRVKPQRVLYAAPTLEQVSKYWHEVCQMLGPAIESGQLKKDETEKYIEVPGTERRLKAKTAWNKNTLRGDFGSRVTLEEFQLMNEDILDIVYPMLLDVNGTLVIVYTPPSLKSEGVSKARDPRHASKLFKKAQADTRWQTFHYTSYDNPLLSQKALAEITNDMSLDAYRREILAEDDEIETSWLVYHKFDEEWCKIKRFAIPENWNVLTGHDFGAANPGALFLARVQLPLPDGAPKSLRYGDYVMFREYAPGAGFSASQHIDRFRELVGKREVKISVGGNVTTEGEIRQLYGAGGWPIVPPLLTKVNAQIDRVLALMGSNELYIFEDLYGVLSEIANCMWELDEEKKPKNKIQNESKYHYLSCLRTLATYLPVKIQILTNERRKVKVW